MSELKENELVGEVSSVLGYGKYLVKVELAGKERNIPCHLSGKMRQFKINVIEGDMVRIVLPPPYDNGRICFREKT